jgi:hypothetical protein
MKPSKLIRIDAEVWAELQRRARPLEDTPNSVLRRVFGLPDERLSIRHDAGGSPAPYVAGTLLAVRALHGRAGRPDAAALVREPSPPVGARRATRWVLLAYVPSTAMLSTTTYLSTDIAAVPMLWVLPLALYLATFVVAFSRWGPRATRVATWLAPPVAVAALVVRPGVAGLPLAVAAQLLVVVVAGLLAHGRLSGAPPPPLPPPPGGGKMLEC